MTVAGPNLPNYTRSNAVSIITWTIQNASCQFNFTVLHNCKVPYSLEVTRDDYISEAKPVTVLYEQHRDKQTGHVVAGWLALTHSQSVAQKRGTSSGWRRRMARAWQAAPHRLAMRILIAHNNCAAILSQRCNSCGCRTYWKEHGVKVMTRLGVLLGPRGEQNTYNITRLHIAVQQQQK